ncbi:MAG: prepilin-type N-terminal cleavage/methylation domain-containing protein [Candidatus Omnitrophica bacterium]|nr:prepilin-type N-terminal cleavage/methylation domain-containing protein [Candidatus Omnitrophota bacterium]
MLSRMHNKTGLTMVEIMIATILLGVVFLAVSSLYLASQKFYLAAVERVAIGYEVQYAIQHIYKNTMQAMGDEISAPSTSGIQLPNDTNTNTQRLDIRINTNNPVTSSNYSSATTYSYYRSGSALIFDNGVTQDDLIPKVTVTAVNFFKDVANNTVTGDITATYGTQSLTFYFACYPRLTSFKSIP